MPEQNEKTDANREALEKKQKKKIFERTAESFEAKRVQSQQPEPEEEGGKKTGVLKQIWLTLRPAVICCIVILLVNWIFIIYAVVPTGSMQPLIMPQSFILANRRAYDNSTPQRGEIIVFETDQSTAGMLVKRVIAIEGDEVTLQNGEVYLNGEKQDESAYAVGKTYANIAGDTFTVPQGCVLVMGDNRESSADSRYWEDPYLPVSQVRGRVFLAFSVRDWYFRIIH